MAGITTCSKCGGLFQSGSEEEANDPGRLCLICWNNRRAEIKESHTLSARCAAAEERARQLEIQVEAAMRTAEDTATHFSSNWRIAQERAEALEERARQLEAAYDTLDNVADNWRRRAQEYLAERDALMETLRAAEKERDEARSRLEEAERLLCEVRPVLERCEQGLDPLLGNVATTLAMARIPGTPPFWRDAFEAMKDARRLLSDPRWQRQYVEQLYEAGKAALAGSPPQTVGPDKKCPLCGVAFDRPHEPGVTCDACRFRREPKP